MQIIYSSKKNSTQQFKSSTILYRAFAFLFLFLGTQYVHGQSSISVSASETDASCNNSDGSISISPSGGDGSNYYYITISGPTSNSTYSNGGTTFSGLPAGYYNINVYDGNNMSDGYAGSTSITVNSASCGTQISISPSETDASCNNSDGSISISASGGDGSNYYYFTISGPTSNSTYGYGSTSFSSLPAGYYTIYVYDGNNTADGYSNSSSITVNSGSSGTQISISPSETDASCNSSDGSISISASGGDGSNYYYFYISGPTSYSSYAYGSTSFSSLPAGYYNIYVYDGNNTGNPYSNSTSITVNSGNCGTQISISPSETDATCNNSNGSINISASGGDGSNYYYFSISGPTSNSTYGYGSTSFSSLPAGYYNIYVYDGNNTGDGYSNSTSITVNSSSCGTPISISPSETDASCNSSNGSISISASGGDGSNYYYFTISGPTSNSTYGYGSTSFSSLPAGYYSIYVYDGNNTGDGNGSSTSITVNNGTCETQISISASETDASCNNSDGSISISASGGDGSNYYYFTISGPTSNSTYAYGSTSFSSLPAGYYNIYVYDANNTGDGYSNSTSITVNSGSCGSQISISASETDASCNNSDGTISISASGGDGSNYYYFYISGPTSNSTYAYGSTSFSSLPAGYYNIYVYDANNQGDGYSNSTSITVNSGSCGSQISISASETDASCNNSDGSISISASGGDGSNYYYFYISGPTSNSTYAYGSTSFSSLPPGYYNIYVYDANNQGDGYSNSTSITVNSGSCGSQISISASETDASCNSSDGTISISASGGDGSNYYYFSISGPTSNSTYAYGNTSFSSLPSGYYNIYVYDANNQGDGYSNSTSITVNSGSCGTQISISPTETDATCGNSNGGISISAFGGDGNNYYYFTISGPTSNSTYAYGNTSFGSLPPGDYTIYVYDGNNQGDGLSNSTSITVNNNTAGCPGQISISTSTVDLTGCNTNDGSISMLLTGGDGSDYYYVTLSGPTTGTQYSNGAASFTSLPAGDYTITAYDVDNNSDGYASSTNVTINPGVTPPPIGNGSQSFCTGSTVADLSATGTDIVWYSDASGGTPFTGTELLLDGTHYYASQTVSGCESVTRLDVEATLTVTIAGSVTSSPDTLCSGNSVHLTVIGNNASIQWQSSVDGISFSNITNAINVNYQTAPLSQSTYYRVLANGNCGIDSSVAKRVTVLASPNPGIISVSKDSVCDGASAALTVSGASGGTIQWQYASSGNNFFNITGANSGALNISPVEAGIQYRVFISNGTCSDSTEAKSIIVIQPPYAAFTDSVKGSVAKFNSSLSTGAVSYSWDFGDGSPTDNNSNPYHEYSSVGKYNVCLTATNISGCSSTQCDSIDVLEVGVKNINPAGWMVYPNPAGDELHVRSSGTAGSVTSIEITDAVGRNIVTQNFNGPLAHEVTINVADLAVGIYYLKIKTGSTDFVQKILKQ